MKTLLLFFLLLIAAPSFGQTVTGNITAASAACNPTTCAFYSIPNTQPSPISAVTVQITGTFTATIQFEATLDGSTWVSIGASPVVTGAEVSSTASTGIWQVNVAGLLGFRARASAYTSGTAVVTLQASVASLADNTVSITGTSASNITQIAGQAVATNGNGVIAVAGAASQGLLVTIAAGSGATSFSTPVMGAAITVSTTTVAPFGTTTTLVQGLYVTNITNAAATVTITDGNNVPFVGTTTFGTSFSIPALSSLTVNMGIVGHVFTGGLNISGGTANALRLWLEGKQ